MRSVMIRRGSTYVGLTVAAAVLMVAAALPVLAGQPKIGICHHTHSATNPRVFIQVALPAVPAHRAHGDEIGVTAAACGVTPTPTPTPTGTPTPTPTATPTPTPTATPTATPTPSPTPTATPTPTPTPA